MSNTPSLTEVQLRDLQSKIDARQKGEEFDLKSLWGDEWDKMVGKQLAGRRFKKAVQDKKLRRVAHDRLHNSPRRDIYKRV